MNLNRNLGSNIKNAREKLNITQSELAKNTGVSQAFISQVEDNLKVPSLEIMLRISKALNTPVEVLSCA